MRYRVRNTLMFACIKVKVIMKQIERMMNNDKDKTKL